MKRVLAAIVAVIACGCGSSRVYLNRDVATALVLIPFDDVGTAAPLKVWPYVEREVAARGYRLVPRDRVGAFYDAKKYNDPAMIQEWSTEELCKEFNADAVVWSRIVAWDQNSVGFYSKVDVAVSAEMCVRDGTPKGAQVWAGEGKDGYTEFNSRKGAIKSFVATLAADPAKYAPAAVEACFHDLPWAGWDPDAPKPAPEAK